MNHSWMFKAASAAALVGFVGMTSLLPEAVHAQTSEALRARHESIKTQLASSPFKRPLVLESTDNASAPRGDVYAVIDHPFRSVTAGLRSGENWCDLLILQTNVKRCLPAGTAQQPMLQVAIGRKHDQPIENAYLVDFKYAVRSASAEYFSVAMGAETGPVGTKDYRLALEAVPIDAGRTFIHMSYAYSTGVAARMATDVYLSTSGRNKRGFSIVGKDTEGKPQYVDGIRGVAERNTMRYFLAIDTFLDTLKVPDEQRAENRLREWFEATERYPLQLHELERDEYLTMKRREILRQSQSQPIQRAAAS